MSDFIRIAYTFIPAISPRWMPCRIAGCFSSGRAVWASIFLMGELKNEQCPRTTKKPSPRTATASIAILVYSIIPYLRQKVQKNRYFASLLPVIHSFLHPVDNYYFSSRAGATAGAVAMNL